MCLASTRQTWQAAPKLEAKRHSNISSFREGVSFHREEGEQGEQGLLLEPQDEEAAICEPAVQEGLVGGREALPQAAALDESA